MLPSRLKLNELTTAHIRLYVDSRSKEVQAASVNREVTIIASALHLAHKDFPEVENWICPRIPRPKVSRSRRERLIKQDEVMKLLTFLLSVQRENETQKMAEKRRVVGQVFQMTLMTGVRISEITALRREQVDFDASVLQIVGTKTRFTLTKAVRYLEITPTIEAILRSRAANSDWEFVFSRTGNSVTHYHKILSDAA